MNIHAVLAALVLVIATATNASAIVVEVEVTPQSLRDNPNLVIKSERRDDGLIHFTITDRRAEPRYLVGSLTLRKDSAIIVQTTATSFKREGSQIYYLALRPEYVAESRFEIAERSFASHDGQEVPFPGGPNYIIRLADFAPAAAKTAPRAK